MYRILLFIIIISSSYSAMGQDWTIPTAIQDLDKKERKQFEKTLDCIKKKKDQKSAEKLERLLVDNPSVYEARKELARYYLNSKQIDKAKTHLLSIAKNETIHDLQVYGELLSIAESEKNYDDAIIYVEKILSDEGLTPQQRTKLERDIDIYMFRNAAIKNPVQFEPTPISSQVNTKESEYLPAFNADGSILIYTSRNTSQRASQEDLYYALQNANGEFSEGKPIQELATNLNEGGHTFSQDGKILIFTSCDRRDSYGGCDLYITFLGERGWSNPQNLGSDINGRYWESQPTLSADNSTLYFSSSRPGGHGKRDIWMSTYKPSGGWTPPTNLGDKINTKGNEETPFLHPDNNTLYFQSDGHIGMGGTDIFLAKRKKEGWSKPKNLGYPINDESNQGALFVELSGNTAYYTKDKTTMGYTDFDIYKFDLPAEHRPENVSYLKLQVKDASTGENLRAQISMNNLETDNTSVISTDQNGFLLKTINEGKYGLSIDKEGYIFHSENISVPKDRVLTNPLEVMIYLQKIVITDETEEFSNPVILKNIFFKSGSAELLASSQYEVRKLYELLVQNEAAKIMITGHTDNVGSENDNQILSEQRAKAVNDALIEKGIMRTRIQYQGKGESEPIADNNTDAGREKNRRTEFYIIY